MRFVLGSKWIAAAALAFALTLPFTTCQSHGGTKAHHISVTWRSIEMYCFLWPLPLLIARSGWKRLRAAWPFPIADLFLAFVALVILTLRIFASAVISLGGIQPGPGYDVAAACLVSYASLSVADLVVIFRDRRRDRAHTPAVLVEE